MIKTADYNRADSISNGAGISRNCQARKEPPEKSRVVFYKGGYESKLGRSR